jgi:hypothetical protein
MGHPPHAVLGEQPREAVLFAHHSGIGELSSQSFDLDAIDDCLKVAHWITPSVGRRRASACVPATRQPLRLFV